MSAVKDYLCELSNRSSPFDQLKFLRACAVAAEELNNSRLAIDCIQEFTSCTALVEDFPGVLVGSECKESLSVADACIFPLVFLFNQLEEGQGVSEMDALDLVSPGKLQHVSLSLGIDADFYSSRMGQARAQQQECGLFD
jgi:hypothetical protein